MMAVQTELHRDNLPSGLGNVRAAIERAVPHGRTNDGGRGDVGAWAEPPARVQRRWEQLLPGYERLVRTHQGVRHRSPECQLGTLGTGNHSSRSAWTSGPGVVHAPLGQPRGRQPHRLLLHHPGPEAGRRRRREAGRPRPGLPGGGHAEYDGYVEAVEWAQEYARVNAS